jgi:transcriptional regulator with XRE-family HTH domain
MGDKVNITSAQIRAARALLNWSARELSQRSAVSQSSIHRAERAKSRPSMREHSLAAIKAALEQHGVEFLSDCGVQLVSVQHPDRPADPRARSARECRSELATGGHH